MQEREPKTLATYTRQYVGDMAGDAMSAAEQRALIRSYIDSRADADWPYFEITEYADIGLDDFDKRPGASLQRLFADAISGKFNVVIIAKPNRLSRHIWILHEIYEQLHSTGVIIYSALHAKALQEVLPPEALKQTATIMRAMDIAHDSLWTAHR